MDYKEKYMQLEGQYRELQKELEKLRSENQTGHSDLEMASNVRQDMSGFIEEILNTISSYLAIFRPSEDNGFYIINLNNKTEETELIKRENVLGKYITDTPLGDRKKLIELLQQVKQTHKAHKLEASTSGNDSEGYYIGFPLTTGNIMVTWEPGQQQKIDDYIQNQTNLFRTFSEMMPGMMYEVDLNGKILYGNKKGLEYFGTTADSLENGIYIQEAFLDNGDLMLRNLQALKSPDDISSNEYFLRRYDGNLIPVVTHSFAVFHNGEKICYRGTITDVSKHKHIEAQIIREKAFLEHLINSTPEAIVLTDLTGRITMANKEFTDLFGYTYEEAINENIVNLVVPVRLKEESLSITKLVSLHNKEVRQTVRKDKYGNERQVSLIATEITVNNEPVAHVFIYRDITTEKKNQLLQEVLYNISSAALKQLDIKELYPIIVSELGKIWDTNNFFIALYDNKTESLSFPFFADEKDIFKETPVSKTITGYLIRNNKSVLLKKNDLQLLEESGEIDLVGSDCKVWMGVPLRVDNNIIGVICLQDYNDENKFSNEDLQILDFIANQIAVAIQRRIMLDNLITARQRAEEAAQSKQIFMSTMSHEIRTPLNEVIGITNLLLQNNPREDQMDFIKTLRFSGNHLLTLVNDVLDYNKMESGKIIFEQTQFNLNDFLDEIMRSYSFRSKAKELDFSIKKEGSLPEDVIGDQIRLNQILSNLLSNALKFTKVGGITVTIREKERKENKSKLEFSVQDTGIGIPAEKHTTIFESFTQAATDTTRHFGGTGLGLAICKKLVELMGGIIEIKSQPGEGSVFTFILDFEIADKKSRKENGEVPESFVGLEGKRILIAEDNKINFFVANKFLTGWGVSVSHAENGQLALEKIETEEFDLILMDLHMPVMDGIEATRIIRNSTNPRIKDIPVVALTAAIMSESYDKIEKLNINDYILKPFKPRDLFERIKKHIR